MEQKTSSRAQRWKQILAIAWPLIVANSLLNLQLTIDASTLSLVDGSTRSAMAVMGVSGRRWHCSNSQFMLRRSSRNTSARASMKKSDQPSGRPYIAVSAAVSFPPDFCSCHPISSPRSDTRRAMRDLEQRYFDAICWSALPTALVAVFSGFFTGLVCHLTCVDQCRRPCRQCHLRLSVHFRSPPDSLPWALPEPATTVLANWASALGAISPI